MDWRGNPAIDPGDTLQTVDSKDNPITVLFGNSEIEFDGGLRFNTSFEIKSLTETDKSKASSTGEAVRKTQIEVDKVKRQITSVIEKTEGYDKEFSEINQKLNEISSTVGKIETQTAYKLYLISTKGDTFKGSAWSTVLQAVVYSADKEVTSELQDSQFKWSRTSSDSESDSQWDASHADGVKQISVSSVDIPAEQATFTCTFSNPDGQPQAVAQITLTIVQDGKPGEPGKDAAIISPTEPEDKSKLWCDTSGEPPLLKEWDGEKWVVVGDPSDTIQQVYEDVYSAIDQTADQIKMEVTESTYAKGEVDQLLSEMSSTLTQTAEGWEMTFEQFQSWVEGTNGETQTAFEELRKYIRFIGGNIELGDQDNDLKCIISNEKISFTQNGNEVAYISNNKLYITSAEVLDRFTVGNPSSGYFDWVPRANGNLGMKWRAS